MTTKVMIFAEHGCPVDAVLVDSKRRTVISTQRIAIDTVGTLFVHAGADLFIHEVQPDELGTVDYDDEASAAADLADAKARAEITGLPIPDPLIDPVVTIDAANNPIIDAGAAQAAQDAADAKAAAAKKAADDRAAADAAHDTQIKTQEAADAAAAQAKIDADAAQKLIDDQAAADEAAASAAAAARAAATPPVVPAPDADIGPATTGSDPNSGTDPVDEEDPAKVIAE